MTEDEIKQQQREEREQHLNAILTSSATKKIIVAGPGTGKTFTFGTLLKRSGTKNNLVMTFIRKLVDELYLKLSDHSEVKTFHSYCKKILHQKNGRIELSPHLTEIIESDSTILGKHLTQFDKKFQTLDESSSEVGFYLKRSDYYQVVSFNDSVYRLLCLLRKDPDILPKFNQIVIDEFQDFNALEVAFINELEKRGPILIVGDDDQAIYEGRESSASHLRDKFYSDGYEKFHLPFCSRCTDVIVKTTNAIVEKAARLGHFSNRISKRYECYLETKIQDSKKYKTIISSTCTLISVIPKYIDSVIENIIQNSPEDIAESHKEGEEYPTVLIIGPKRYLLEVEKYLKNKFSNISYLKNEESGCTISHAYEHLLKFEDSNFGWRIVAEHYLDARELKRIIMESENDVPIHQLLKSDFVTNHLRVIEIIKSIQKGDDLNPDQLLELKNIVGNKDKEIVEHFKPKEVKSASKIDKSQPSILLCTYMTCKGLSGGHVFILGANNGTLPKNPNQIKNIEISEFIVALTRTRKSCHIISNQWEFSPKKGVGFLPQNDKSIFCSWIPSNLISDRGKVTAKSLAAKIMN